jgi:hypothetical protein
MNLNQDSIGLIHSFESLPSSVVVNRNNITSNDKINEYYDYKSNNMPLIIGASSGCAVFIIIVIMIIIFCWF